MINLIKTIDPKKLTNEKILELAQKYGREARLWRQRFAGLLPEINRRKLYEKKGCPSIFVYAKISVCMSEEQTRNVLNLDQQFEEFPLLHKILVNGEVSIHKLIRICSVLNKDNENFWANQVKTLSKKALETLVKDEKMLRNISANSGNSDQAEIKFGENGVSQDRTLFNFSTEKQANDIMNFEDQNGYLAPKNEASELPGQPDRIGPKLEELASPAKIIQLELAKDVTTELLELQRKGININELLREFLQKREEEIETEKQELSESVLQQAKNQRFQNSDDASGAPPSKKPSRYISVKIKNLLQKEHGNKCSIPTCNKPSEEIDHLVPFALIQNHDPRNLRKLCKEHHQIAHSIDQKYQQKRRYD